VAHVIMDKM